VIHTLAAADKSGSPVGSIVLLGVLGAAFYFVAIRPNRRRMQQMQSVQRDISTGREVVTTSGLYGTVTAVDDLAQTVTLQIAPGVEARFARGAVMKVVEPAPEGLD
jgi:preprotein translocase subunit YajC